MTQIVFVQPDGTRDCVEAPNGTTFMHAAVAAGIDGIVAECGGSAMCATCHVYVDPDQVVNLPPPNAVEDEMLDSTAGERRPNSRLSCQLWVTSQLEGLVIHLPERQV